MLINGFLESLRYLQEIILNPDFWFRVVAEMQDMRQSLECLCSLSTSLSNTFHLWGTIMLYRSINTLLYFSSSKIHPFSGFTFNSLPSFPSAAILHPRCWKLASCSAGFQDLNQNFWHSVHNVGCVVHLFWTSSSPHLKYSMLFSDDCCIMQIEDSSLLSQWLFHLPYMYHPSVFQNVGWKAYLGHSYLTWHSRERKVICPDYCFFLLRQICSSLLAFCFSPML